MSSSVSLGAVGAAVLACIHGAGWCQSSLQAPLGPPSLPPITVSASALELSGADMSTPVSLLEGDALVLRRGATLGGSLESENGVRSSHFGAGAGRPVIRGMDGPRVRVLADGLEIHDASIVSPDHAVAAEPLLARQIELLRGPSALAYGGGAIGGVVNILDRRMPERMPKDGFEGSLELQGATGAREGAGAFEFSQGIGESLVLHLEGARRDAGDYRVGRGFAGGGRVEGSFADSRSFGAGLSWIHDRGFAGIGYARQKSFYGLPGHVHDYEGCHTHGPLLHCPRFDPPGDGDGDGHGHGDDHGHGHGHGQNHGHDHGHGDDHDHGHTGVPYIDLLSERWETRGEYREPFAGIARLRWRGSFTDYRHDEIEGAEIATTFKNRAHDGRLELEHRPVAGWRGVVGLQASRRRFSALGEEAYVEPSVTNRHALFVLEEKLIGDLRLEAAARQEWQRIELAAPHSESRRQRGSSVSAGAVWRFAPGYSLSSSLSRSDRLPTVEELHAKGLHLATRTYELGDPTLLRERSHNIDLGLAKSSGDTTFGLDVFQNRVDGYIHGRTLDAVEGLQLIRYTQSDASFRGVEGQLRQQLDKVFGLTVFGDHVRARLRQGVQGNRNLPRMPAQRLGLRLDASHQGWGGLVEVYRMSSQRHVAAYESLTPGYTMLNLGLSYQTRLQDRPTLLYARLDNATDRLAFSSTSFIKDVAPLRGRSLTLGGRMSF